MYRHKRQKSTKEKSVVSLKAAYEALAQLDDWNEKTLEDTMMALPAQYLLGKEESLRRIQVGIDRLEKDLATA